MTNVPVKRLKEILHAFNGQQIIVVGDIMWTILLKAT